MEVASRSVTDACLSVALFVQSSPSNFISLHSARNHIAPNRSNTSLFCSSEAITMADMAETNVSPRMGSECNPDTHTNQTGLG